MGLSLLGVTCGCVRQPQVGTGCVLKLAEWAPYRQFAFWHESGLQQSLCHGAINGVCIACCKPLSPELWQSLSIDRQCKAMMSQDVKYHICLPGAVFASFPPFSVMDDKHGFSQLRVAEVMSGYIARESHTCNGSGGHCSATLFVFYTRKAQSLELQKFAVSSIQVSSIQADVASWALGPSICWCLSSTQQLPLHHLCHFLVQSAVLDQLCT